MVNFLLFLSEDCDGATENNHLANIDISVKEINMSIKD